MLSIKANKANKATVAMPTIRAKPAPSTLKGIDFGNRLDFKPRPQAQFFDSRLSITARHDNDHVHFRDIKIFPTTDEILAVKAPVYMPKKNDASPNPICQGPERYLDFIFRHLRFESFDAIKDIAYSAAQTAFVHSSKVVKESGCRRETPAGARYFMYNNAKVEELQSSELHITLVRISFDCPKFMQGRSLINTGRFEPGMLLALQVFDNAKKELSIRFLQIAEAQSTMSMDPRGGKGRRAAVQAILMDETASQDVLYFARLAQNLEPGIKSCLIEFPKMLPNAMFSPLKRLQTMDGFAFEQYIAPRRDMNEILNARFNRLRADGPPLFDSQAPEYARKEGYTYDLSHILPGVENKKFSLDDLTKQSTMDTIRAESTLDEGQAKAFLHCLTNEFALVQGPPGTGKTYLGTNITKVLHDSRPTPKPILVVCLTNHALDSFLGDLKEAGFDELIRIGNGSKEAWTAPFNLKEVARKGRLTHRENGERIRLTNKRNEVFQQISTWCENNSAQSLTGTLPWDAISKWLGTTKPTVYQQLKLTDNPVSQKFVFQHWTEGGSIKDMASLLSKIPTEHRAQTNFVNTSKEQAGRSSVWQLTPNQRKALLATWQYNIDPEQLAHELAAKYSELHEIKESLAAITEKKQIRALESAPIIGITTTGCANRWDLLNKIGITTVVCEEAGEVMEPHVLLSLLPSIEHGIFIGDPDQLRSEVSQMRFDLERSSDYRLNESLFERMIKPIDQSTSAMPFSQLTIQRRMHPDIAEIPKIIYPDLQNHESTETHPSTIGIKDRMFWWDHDVPEDNDPGETKSHVNTHEVKMVAGLAEHLVKTNGYKKGDLAVLTAYSGQLVELKKALDKPVEIHLDDEDREALLDVDQLDDSDQEASAVCKKDAVSLADMLRITTVDNFQGEEAKVVIISTVRSGGRAGFLKNENRINVACSRAREGFYIVGNAGTLAPVGLWKKVIDVFGPRRGPAIKACCSGHPGRSTDITDPKGFASLPACPIICGETLACGHICARRCHAGRLHGLVGCPGCAAGAGAPAAEKKEKTAEEKFEEEMLRRFPGFGGK